MEKEKRVKKPEWFFKWIERRGKGATEYLFVTSSLAFGNNYNDKEFSYFDGFYDNKMFSFEAIRKCFGLKKGEGVERSVERFWEKKNFTYKDEAGKEKEIVEITSKIGAFDLNFQKFMDKGYFSNEQLISIIKTAPEQWKNRAWKQFIDQNAGPNRRASFLWQLGGLFEYWFVKPDALKKDCVVKVWQEKLAQHILDIRLGQVQEIYHHLYEKMRTPSYEWKRNRWDWDFQMLPTVPEKLKKMFLHFKKYDKGIDLNPDIVPRKEICIWDLTVVGLVFDEYSTFGKNSRLLSSVFDIIALNR